MPEIAALLGSALALIGSAAQRRPWAVAGLAGFCVAFAFVTANALHQVADHPRPLIVTRPLPDRTAPPAPRPAPVKVAEARDTTDPVIAQSITEPAARGDDELLMAVQMHLVERGLYEGAVDGRDGPRTRDGVRRLQAALGLEETGMADEALLDRLDGDVPAKTASAAGGDSVVRRVQQGLARAGESGIAVDGLMGERTAAAIRAFQGRHRLPVTGTPDKAVIEKLAELGVLPPS